MLTNMATVTKAKKRQKAEGRRQKDDSPYGETVPRVLEPYEVPIPKETRCQAWVQAGRLDNGRWVAGLEAEDLGSGKHTVVGPQDVPDLATREKAFEEIAAHLYELAYEDTWPPAAINAIADFRAAKPWIDRQQRHEEKVAAKRANGLAQPAAIGDRSQWRDALGTATPPGGRLGPDGLKKLAWEWGLAIDPEFRAEQRQLSEDERRALKALLAAEGCCDPIRVWQPRDQVEKQRFVRQHYVIDGHNRYELCQELGLPFAIVSVTDLADRAAVLEWIRTNQLARRNLSPEDRDKLLARRKARDELLAREYRAEVGRRKAEGKRQKAKVGAQDEPAAKINDPQNGGTKKAAAVVAEKHGVSPATVKRAEQKLRGRERIASLTHLSLGQLAALKPGEIISLDQLDDNALGEALAGGIDAWRLGREAQKLSAHAAEKPRKKQPAAEKPPSLSEELRRHVRSMVSEVTTRDRTQEVRRLIETLDDRDQRNAADLVRVEAINVQHQAQQIVDAALAIQREIDRGRKSRRKAK